MQLRSGEAVAVVQGGVCSSIQPLAWELPYAAGTALERPKKQKQKSRIMRIGTFKPFQPSVTSLAFSSFSSWFGEELEEPLSSLK